MQLDHEILQTQLSTLISNLQEAILVENEERKILLSNQMFCSMFGIEAKPEDMIGWDCANAAEESKAFFKNPEQFVQRIEELLSKKEVVIGDELETIYGQFLERDYVPVFLDNKYKGHMWKYRDVTKNKKLLNQVKDQNEELKEFAYMLSHDLKEPIRGIKNLLDFVNDEIEENNIEEAKEHLLKMEKRVIRTQLLINGILEYSKIGMSELNIDEELDLNMLISNLKSNFSDRNVQFNFSKDLPTIKGNETMLTQVFNNLLSNSIKYSSKDIPSVYIENGSTPNSILFYDDGPGINTNDVHRIFKPFTTLENDKYDKLSSGIGLSIVHKILKKHNASINIDTTYKDGLKYIIQF